MEGKSLSTKSHPTTIPSAFHGADDPESRVKLARAYRHVGLIPRAYAEVRSVLRADPSLASAWWVLADVFVDLELPAKAAEAFGRAQALDAYRNDIIEARQLFTAGNVAGAHARYQAILCETPTNIGALCGLAATFLSQGRSRDAWRLLRRAAAQSAYFPPGLRLQGQALLDLGRLQEARDAIRCSLDLEPRNEHGWIAWATVEGRLMRPEAALQAYRQAESLNPSLRLLHLSIGHMLKTLGRRQECERVYHECLQSDPQSGEAYWSLADLKNYVFSDSEVAAMETALHQSVGDDANAALLHFALGRAREQCRAYADAFAHYSAGNRLRKAREPFDFDAFESRSQRIIASLDKRFFDAHRGSGIADDSPIFIIGLPRSGSTLVEQILASHSRVEGTMELPNILNYVREFEQLSACGDAYPESLRDAPQIVLEALGRRYLKETRPLRRGCARFIDKLPNNFSHVGFIYAMLPNATIIDVRRHPLDVGLSCFKQNFASGQAFSYDLAGLGRYYRQYLALMDHWDAVLPGKVLHVSYEDLVHAPEPVIRRLLAHCRLEFEAGCLQFHETQRAIRTASSEQVRRPMTTSGVGYWRNFEIELRPLRDSLGECLQRFASPERPLPARAAVQSVPRYAQTLPPRLLLSCAIGAALYTGITAQADPASPPDDALAEVVVTSRRRVENLQDVPQNVDVFTAQNLKNLDTVRIEDVVGSSPSMSMISTGPGGQRITIRGASDGSGPNFGSANVSTTSFMVDDLELDFYGHNPDLHLYDIERIEILNGPQGFLFGPSALAGTVHVITNKPDPKGFNAGADFDGGTISGGSKNWTYEGYANIPLIEGMTALRLSAFSERDGGYIDNVPAARTWLNGVTSNNAPWAGDNFNVRNTFGGRAALLQNIGDAWRVTLTGNYQQQRYLGTWEDDPENVGPHLVQRFSPSGGYNYARFLELNVDGDAGIGDLIYNGGVSSQSSLRLYDFSEYSQYSNYASFIQPLTCATDPLSGPGNDGCKAPYMYGRVLGVVRRFSNEIRLQSKPGRAHWTVGVYSAKTRNPYSGDEHLPNINFGGAPAQDVIAAYGNLAVPTPGDFYTSFVTVDAAKASEFGDVAFDLSDAWNIEAGLEHFHSSTSEALHYANYFYLPQVSEYYQSSADKTNAKAGLNFKPSIHSLVYFSFAQGFRDGGFNPVPTGSSSGVPLKFAPDTLNNYELGLKTQGVGGRLVWNTAAYYMAWKGYQTSVSIPGPPFGFNANIGDARIAGLETTLVMLPVDDLQLSLNADYNDARLRSNSFQNPSFIALPGERLPEAPLFNCSGIARYERRIASESAYLQLDIAHKGSMWNSLKIDQRTLQPAYSLVNFRIGLSDAAGAWRAEGYVTNVANKRAIIYTDTLGYNYFPGHSTPQSESPPRVIGLHLSYNWRK